MKKIKTYNSFINEGVRDKMTPKSRKDVEEELEKFLKNTQILIHIESCEKNCNFCEIKKSV